MAKAEIFISHSITWKLNGGLCWYVAKKVCCKSCGLTQTNFLRSANLLQFQSMKLDLTAIEPCILKGLTIIHLPDLLLFLVLTLIFLYPLPRTPFR